MDITLLLSTIIISEYFLLVYTLMHSIIGHISIKDTSAVLMYYLMIKRMHPLGIGILGIFIRTSPMSVSARFMPLQMQMMSM
jgi:hypothetical protein